MPYGIPASAGGDSPENTKKMERCVAEVRSDGTSEESAIRICKSRLFGSKKGLQRSAVRSATIHDVDTEQATPVRRAFRAADITFRAPEGSSKKGEADIALAVFDVPDKGVPTGLMKRQTIRAGAFETIISSGTLGKRPFYLDHGDATFTGYVDSTKLIGVADGWAEEPKHLRMTAHYNLKTPMGELAWEQANFEPEVIEFSFRSPADEDVEEVDGEEFVTSFHDVQEASQVGFAAQPQAGILAMRTAEIVLPPTEAQLRQWMQADEFRDVLTAVVRSVLTDDAARKAAVTEGLDEATTEEKIVSTLREDPEMAERINAALKVELRSAPAGDPAVAWYTSLFAAAQPAS